MKFVLISTIPQTELTLERHYLDIADFGLLSDYEIDKLFRYAQDPQAQTVNHRLSGQPWPEQKLEYMTFPIRSWRLTALLKHPISYNLGVRTPRNSNEPFDEGSVDSWSAYLDKPDDSGALTLPEPGNSLLIRYLGLRAPPNSVSCYHVEDLWAREQIRDLVARLHDANRNKRSKVMVAPLLKAAILESVRYI